LAWFKTAEWHWISVHQSLVDFGLIDQYFYFSVPNALGVEKLLNGILFLLAAFSYLFLYGGLFFSYLSILTGKNNATIPTSKAIAVRIKLSAATLIN
jgi:hypothetical protein